MGIKRWFKYMFLAVLALGSAALAQSCTIPVGVVLPLTGSLAAQGQENAQVAELAAADLSAAGGVLGCTIKPVVYDSQTRPSVAVDAAKKLVDINHVPAIVGAVSSGVSMAMLTSVTAPSKVVQVSPASTSPAFTQLAKEGKTGGYWFRTPPSDALQGVAMANVAYKQAGLQRVAVIYLNNPYGLGLANRFKEAFSAYGGTVTSMVVYNPRKPSYRSEVSKALKGSPQALFLVAYPTEGATIMREWISNQGPTTYLFPDALNSPQFIGNVGGRYLNGHVWGTVPGSLSTPSLTILKNEFKAKFGHGFTQPYDPNSYDAMAVIGLAMQAAGSKDPSVFKNYVAKITSSGGTPVEAGVAGFKKAFALLKAGKTIRYIGTSGALQFDAYGDVQGPEVVWRVQDGKIVDTGSFSAARIGQITKELGLK